MKNKTAIIVLIILVVLIAIVLFLQYSKEQGKLQTQQQQSIAEMQLAQQYLQYQHGQDVLEAQQTTTLKDWLGTVSNLAGAVSNFFAPGSG